MPHDPDLADRLLTPRFPVDIVHYPIQQHEPAAIANVAHIEKYAALSAIIHGLLELALQINADKCPIRTAIIDALVELNPDLHMRIISDQQILMMSNTSNSQIVRKTRTMHHASELFIPRYRIKRFIANHCKGLYLSGGACIRTLRVKSLDETRARTAFSMQDVLPEALQIALVVDGINTNIESITSQTSPHAKLVATGEDNHYLILPHEGSFTHITTSSPQQLQAADRCNGSTYNRMLKRMDKKPTRSTRCFWRREVCIDADRDGGVAKAVNHSIASGTAESTNEITCRQHRIHDVATEASGTYLHDHIAAVNHAFKALEDAHNRREFRT